jgi:predicted metalloprotease with PDZ domain
MLAGIDVAVAYSVRVRPSQHELDVELTVNLAGETVQLATPTWVPGDYGFASYGRDVFDVQARDAATGSDLPVARDGWQGYRIEGRGQAVRVTYTVSAYSTDFGEPCGLVDSDFAVLTGTRYLRLPAWSGPVRVSYELPAGWNMHHPSGAKQVGETSWEYPSYEILLDTPVVMGRFDLLTRNVKGTPFHFAFVDRALGYQSRVESFVDRVSAVAERMDDIFGSFPFADYTFVLSTNPTADWGLEHLTSTMCGLGPDVFIDDDQFAHGVRVCAHELFHAWNVRRLRPAPLKRLDLTSGSFTEGLWMAEGFTRYYEFLLCTRTGVYTPEQFFSSIVNYYTHLTATPAYERVSAADSSYASYLNHPKYSGRCNNSIDYYDKGMLIAFGLDATLRTENPPDSLDRAFSAFYQAYVGSTSGYSLADVVHFFNDVRSGLGESIGHQVRHAAGLSVDFALGGPWIPRAQEVHTIPGPDVQGLDRPRHLQHPGHEPRRVERHRAGGCPGERRRLSLQLQSADVGGEPGRPGGAGCAPRPPETSVHHHPSRAPGDIAPDLVGHERAGQTRSRMAPSGRLRAGGRTGLPGDLLRKFPRHRNHRLKRMDRARVQGVE